MPESRDQKRIERYRELRALGYDSKTARRLRDASGKNIELFIGRDQRRISRKPIQTRTSSEAFRLRRIQNRYRTQTELQRKARLSTREERWQEFAEYSKSGIWPAEFRRRIREINRRAGFIKDANNNKYGFRRFYYEYVERLSREESIELSELGDSEAKFIKNEPLVRDRQNLRALFAAERKRKSA